MSLQLKPKLEIALLYKIEINSKTYSTTTNNYQKTIDKTISKIDFYETNKNIRNLHSFREARIKNCSFSYVEQLII